ncbi:LysR family transcriptional regulator [Bradyrhizobium sp. INPA03-11B]|uniref:LysR family transcriptional regulator n=1 Tax=Bradyrhizobium sp. INPA03-11B TaxID=418598 RepID=UPI00338F1A42
MSGPNLQNVATFLKVVDLGGFASAARELGVTQSTVSRRVADLEQHLACKLLERTTRRLSLTEAGARYCESVRALVTGLAAADADLNDDHGHAQGSLRVTAPLGYGRTCVLPALAQFSELHPQVHLQIDFFDRYADLFKDGYDFAIRLAEPQVTGLDARSVGWIKPFLCATPTFLNSRPIKKIEDLESDRCLVQRTYAPRTVWSVRHAGVSKHLQIKPRMVLSDIYAIHDMALAGVGAAILPDFLVTENLNQGRLSLVSPDIALDPVPIFLVWPSYKANLPRVRALREFLEQALRTEP